MKLYEVGGCVRDKLLGVKSNDIDIAVEASSWEEMREFVIANTKKVFLEKPEFLTIRAQDLDGKTKDFVLCRKDGIYSDARHPDSVQPGTIYDDSLRRDFSLNAMYIDVQTGKLIDFHGGQEDLMNGMLRCVGNAEDRFNEDSLRIIRGIRFSITKNLRPDSRISDVFLDRSWAPKLENISRERIREELGKCFKHDTIKTMYTLTRIVHGDLVKVMFADDIWLKPTNEKR